MSFPSSCKQNRPGLDFLQSSLSVPPRIRAHVAGHNLTKCTLHQIEGLVVDRNLNLGNLMGMIEAFFLKLGLTDIRFKPTYNPYTEPSMEIFHWHEVRENCAGGVGAGGM
jgi:hypothetical protein